MIAHRHDNGSHGAKVTLEGMFQVANGHNDRRGYRLEERAVKLVDSEPIILESLQDAAV